MKKIFLVFFLVPILTFAQTGNSMSTTSPTVTSTTTATTTQSACINAALEKRENALIAGHDAFAVAIKAALQKRLENLKDAWSQTDKKLRQEKRSMAWKIFKDESQAAHTAMKATRQKAWKTFENEMRACGVRGHGEGPHVIQQPSVAL